METTKCLRGSIIGGLKVIAAILMFGAWPTLARADDAERLRVLEEQVRILGEEIKALRARVAEQDKAGSQPPAGGPPASARDDSTRDALVQSQQNNERLDMVEQRLDQQGVQVHFNEGIFLEDPRGDWSLRLSGRVQLDYRRFLHDRTVADTFSLRRARFGVDATLYRDYRIVVEAEYASGNATGTSAQHVGLTLGYLDIGLLGPGARIRLGQFKPAFGYEQTLQDLYSDYMERSFGQSLLQNLNYDRGVMVYGAPVTGLWYGVTLSNGTGQNLEEKQASAQEVDAAKPEVTGRLTANLAQLLVLRDRIFQVGGSFKRGEVANSGLAGTSGPYSAASVQTEARGAVFFTPAPFNANGQIADNIDRRHWAYEYLLAYGPFKIQGEHAEVAYRDARITPAPSLGFERTLKSDTVSAMWLVTGEHYADFFRDSTIGKIRPRNRFSLHGDGLGALELGLRYSQFDGTDFHGGNPDRTGQLGATAPVTTSTNEASAITFQVKWIPNVYTRFWLDWVRTRFDTPIVVNGTSASFENAVLMRTQVDF